MPPLWVMETGQGDLPTVAQGAVLYPTDGDKCHHFSLEGLKHCGQVQLFSS